MQKVSFIIIAIFIVLQGKAQQIEPQDVILSHNKFLFNPAETGEYNGTIALLQYRQKWTDIKGAPLTTSLFIDSKLDKNAGLGIAIRNYKHGLESNFIGKANYSYTINITSKQILKFGLSVGFVKEQYDRESMRIYQNDDPLLNYGDFNTTKFTSGVGFAYCWNNLEADLSAPRLIEGIKPVNNYYSLLSYKVNLKDDQFTIKPYVTYQYLQYGQNQATYNLELSLQDKIFVMGGYSTEKTLVLGFGINYHSFIANYTYGINEGILSHISKNNHEIRVGYLFYEITIPSIIRKTKREYLKAVSRRKQKP
jgi:type IX secretion system PorP/SprF family membrane protein